MTEQPGATQITESHIEPGTQPSASSGEAPPVLIYVPGLSQTPENSALRISELIAFKMNKRPGTYAVKDLSSPEVTSPETRPLIEGRRIVEVGSGPVLDVYTLDYRPFLTLPSVDGSGVGAVLRRFLLTLRYFFRAIFLVSGARKRAKSTTAKWQLGIGLGVVAILLVAVASTAVAIPVALGWEEPGVGGTVADALALGLTGFTTWIFFNARPAVRRTTTLIEQLMDYADDEQQAAGIAGVLDTALDALLEPPGSHREIHVLGYSFGALVAIDFLYPRNSLRLPTDDRHKTIKNLITVGCPVDFIRLYKPDYTDQRTARIPDLPWTNVFIAADVFGSNFIDGDDFGEYPPDGTGDGREPPPQVATITPDFSYRYTDERLTRWNIWGRKGFLSHGSYWDERERENCLHLVLPELFRRQPAATGH